MPSLIDERVVPGLSRVSNLQQHIARYNLTLKSCTGSVLDLACGIGYGSFLMSLVANSVTGVDISKKAVDYALTNFVKENLGFVESDILKFKNEPVDLVVSLETVEHIKDLDRLEDKFLQLLKPGGKLIYSVPLYENYDNPYHFHRFTLETGLKLFSELQLEDYVIQNGLSFTLLDNKKPFTYLIVSKIKPF